MYGKETIMFLYDSLGHSFLAIWHIHFLSKILEVDKSDDGNCLSLNFRHKRKISNYKTKLFLRK